MARWKLEGRIYKVAGINDLPYAIPATYMESCIYPRTAGGEAKALGSNSAGNLPPETTGEAGRKTGYYHRSPWPKNHQ